MGNQLTKDKVLEINGLSPLPYEPPEPTKTEDIEVVEEEDVDVPQQNSEGGNEEGNKEKTKDKPAKKSPKKPKKDSGDDQPTLFD